jgi:hypothetical protein
MAACIKLQENLCRKTAQKQPSPGGQELHKNYIILNCGFLGFVFARFGKAEQIIAKLAENQQHIDWCEQAGERHFARHENKQKNEYRHAEKL